MNYDDYLFNQYSAQMEAEDAEQNYMESLNEEQLEKYLFSLE